MTAHPPKPTITPEILGTFRRYYVENPVWGVLHTEMEEGNFKHPSIMAIAAEYQAQKADVPPWLTKDLENAGELGRECCRIYDILTPSQRRRLRDRVERMR